MFENSSDILDNLRVSEEQLGLSIKCHKTRTKVIHSGHSQRTQTIQQTRQNSKQNNTSIWNEGQENVHEGVMIGFGFTFEWMTKW